MGSLPTRVRPTTKGPGTAGRRVRTPVQGRDPRRSPREAQGSAGGTAAAAAGPGRASSAPRPGGAPAGTPGAAPHLRPARGVRSRGSGWRRRARCAPGRGPKPSRAPLPGGPRRPSPAAAPPPRVSASGLGAEPGPTPPGCAAGPAEDRAPRAMRLPAPCGGAAGASRGRDLRRRRRRLQSWRGRRLFQEGVGSALPRSRGPPPTNSGVPAARPPRESRARGPARLPPLGVPNSYPGLEPSVGSGTASFQSLCGRARWRSSPNKRKDGIRGILRLAVIYS